MNRLLLAAVGLAAVAASAMAADMPRSRSLPPPRAPAYVPFFTWNGFYIGVNAGYGFGKSQWTDTVTQVSTEKFDVNGPLVGGTLGYNLQFGTWVFGLEGDLAWSNIKGSATTNCPGAGTCETSNNWLGTARGRIGYAFDRFMPYFTAGAAFGDIKGTFSLLGIQTSRTETKVGWTAGAGLEYAFVDRWSAKIEYLYVDLGTATCDTNCSGGGNPLNVTFKTNLVRAGLNYKF
jgi:outer membrane immunogenic protein